MSFVYGIPISFSLCCSSCPRSRVEDTKMAKWQFGDPWQSWLFHGQILTSNRWRLRLILVLNRRLYQNWIRTETSLRWRCILWRWRCCPIQNWRSVQGWNFPSPPRCRSRSWSWSTRLWSPWLMALPRLLIPIQEQLDLLQHNRRCQPDEACPVPMRGVLRVRLRR